MPWLATSWMFQKGASGLDCWQAVAWIPGQEVPFLIIGNNADSAWLPLLNCKVDIHNPFNLGQLLSDTQVGNRLTVCTVHIYSHRWHQFWKQCRQYSTSEFGCFNLISKKILFDWKSLLPRSVYVHDIDFQVLSDIGRKNSIFKQSNMLYNIFPSKFVNMDIEMERNK